MAPTSSTEEVKHLTLHHLLKQQHRLKPVAVVWRWPTVVPGGGAGRPVPDEQLAVDNDGLGGTWPPRSYTCAFCRREFRSAQALGGHMNVHRRDRAKMRGHGLHGAGGQLAAASAGEAPAAAARTEYAVALYPILNSGAAGATVLRHSGDVLLSAPVTLSAARRGHGPQCNDVGDDENDKKIDLELRLGWP